MTKERKPRFDDCPHCGKSNWMGLNNPEGCQCSLQGSITVMQRFTGSPVTASAPGRNEWVEARYVDVRATVVKRVELFHFIRDLEFHLSHARESLERIDASMRRQGRHDGTCMKCGFVKCACDEEKL